MNFWGGFVEGKLHIRKTDSGFGGWGETITEQPAIFKARADALKEYQDVRPLLIEVRRSDGEQRPEPKRCANL